MQSPVIKEDHFSAPPKFPGNQPAKENLKSVSHETSPILDKAKSEMISSQSEHQFNKTLQQEIENINKSLKNISEMVKNQKDQ